MARAMWKGTIKLGGQSIGVKLYSAVQDRQIRFHLLHASDKQPVRQRMVDPSTGEPVAPDQVHKGFPVEPSVFVLLEPKDLAALEPRASRDIEIGRCVPAAAIDPQWYDRPYFLGPDGAGDGYFALHEALQRSERVAIARWVMRKREYSGAIAPYGDHLVVTTLRDAAQIIDMRELEVPTGRDFDPRELALAEQLITALQGDFDPAEFKNEYRERVLAFIEQKAKGKAPKLKPLRARKPNTDELTSALQASLRHVKEKASA